MRSFFSLFLLPFLFGISVGLPQSEITALIRFGQAIGWDYQANAAKGNLCIQKENYPPYHTLDYVSCENDHITRLNVGRLATGGIMPEYDLTHLSNLTSLRISTNLVSGSIRPGVHVPLSLRELDLLGSSITSLNLTECNLVYLAANSLNALPIQCPTLTSLTLISVSMELLDVENQFPQLTTLKLDRCNFGKLSVSSSIKELILGTNSAKEMNVKLVNDATVVGKIGKLNLKGMGGNANIGGNVDTLNVVSTSVPLDIGMYSTIAKMKSFNAAPSSKFGELNLARYQLTSFSGGDNSTFKKLDLSHNNLTSFEWTGIEFMDFVSVTNNQLKSLDTKNVAVEKARYCDFSGNEFVCPIDERLKKFCFSSCK